jgi:hypothetical protein
MSKEHISTTLPPNTHTFLREKLCCIICKTTLDINTKEHKCILRSQYIDIVIHSKNT